jgi:hypothetical protein
VAQVAEHLSSKHEAQYCRKRKKKKKKKKNLSTSWNHRNFLLKLEINDNEKGTSA